MGPRQEQGQQQQDSPAVPQSGGHPKTDHRIYWLKIIHMTNNINCKEYTIGLKKRNTLILSGHKDIL